MKTNEIKVGDEVTVNGVWGIVDEITDDGFYAIDQDGKDFFVSFVFIDLGITKIKEILK